MKYFAAKFRKTFSHWRLGLKHLEMFRVLEGLEIAGKYLQLIRNLYWEQSAAIRIDEETSKLTSGMRGVRQ